MASGQSFFQQPFRTMDFKHAHSRFYIYYAVSYDVQLSAFTDINKGVSHLHPRQCERCSFWILWCSWAATQLGYSDGQNQDPACAPRHYQEQGGSWMLDSWTSRIDFVPAWSSPSLQHQWLTVFSVSDIRVINTRPFPACRGTGHKH